MKWLYLALSTVALGAVQQEPNRIVDLPRSVRAGTSIPVLITVPTPPAGGQARYLFVLFYRAGQGQVNLQYQSPALQDNRPGDEETKSGLIKHLVPTSEAWLAISDTGNGDRRQPYQVVLHEQETSMLPQGLVVDLAMTPGVVVTGSVGQVALGTFFHGQLTQVERQVSMWERPTAERVCNKELFQLSKESQNHVVQCGPLTVPWTTNISKAPSDEVVAIARAEELKSYERSIREIEKNVSAVADGAQRKTLLQRVRGLLGRITNLIP